MDFSFLAIDVNILVSHNGKQMEIYYGDKIN